MLAQQGFHPVLMTRPSGFLLLSRGGSQGKAICCRHSPEPHHPEKILEVKKNELISPGLPEIKAPRPIRLKHQP